MLLSVVLRIFEGVWDIFEMILYKWCDFKYFFSKIERFLLNFFI